MNHTWLYPSGEEIDWIVFMQTAVSMVRVERGFNDATDQDALSSAVTENQKVQPLLCFLDQEVEALLFITTTTGGVLAQW